MKRVHYDSATVNIADLSLGYYLSGFRVALSALPSHSSTAGSAESYRQQLAFASGEEMDKPAGAGAVVKTSVRSAALYGRHWFARWALTYTLGQTRHGDSRRDGAGLGLRYRS